MKRLVSVLLLVFVSFVTGCGKSEAPEVIPPNGHSVPAEDPLDPFIDEMRDPALQKIALEAIKKLGGRVEFDKSGEVMIVDLSGKKVADSDLVNLKGLTNLQSLYLNGTQITDAGLVHLTGFSSLQVLTLISTQVSDAGLFHLKSLTSLKRLMLGVTLVTDAGLKDLQAALPNCSMDNQLF